MEIIFYSFGFLLLLFLLFLVIGKSWSSNIQEFLFANRSLQVVSSGAAISSHWLWAIALFIGPAIAYNWGIIGLLWFAIPNALALITVAVIVRKIRDKYPNGFSLTAYVKENFSSKVSALYQFEFIVVAFGALLLAFTAISKLWGFAELSSYLDPVYASLVVGIITLLFTLKGGIRTGIVTGTIQTVLWVGFLAVALYALFNTGLPVISFGKNELYTVFDPKFLTTFAIAYLITISASSSGHGHLWQKAFSMPKENILPSFAFGAAIFALILMSLQSIAMFTQVNGIPVPAADMSALSGIVNLLGLGALVFFSVLFIGQTSTVIDSSMTYFSSLISLEWFNDYRVGFSRLVMVLFLLSAWLVSWAGLSIWQIMMLMGAVRTVMFVPLVLHILGARLKEIVIFVVSIITIPITFFLTWTARVDKLPIYDMYAAIIAIGLPLTCYLGYKLLNKESIT
jgi:urea-proton symporter